MARTPNLQVIESMKSKLDESKKVKKSSSVQAKFAQEVKSHAEVLQNGKEHPIYKALVFFINDMARRKGLWADLDVNADPQLEYRVKLQKESMRKGMETVMGFFSILDKSTYYEVDLKEVNKAEEVI